MKILAIRGRNLASLGGDFAVELAKPPLSSVGIFAISGPTGAGKTTLLDALCLALYDRTPRLSDRGGVRVGMPGEDDALWVASQDVRSLLRKGCVTAMAEVDFAGRDGRVYRARWSVRRSRDRVDGQLQGQVMTLMVPETGALIGRTKSEVLEEIKARLGLSFEQFRRSALLAQGDFAAFLRSGERERAELLEQMTGTELYGQVSTQAYERSKQEQQAYEELRERLGGVRLLTDEERAGLVGAQAEAEREAEQARRSLVAAEEARAAARAQAELRAAAQKAEQALAEARAAWEAAAQERAAVAQAEAALPMLPSLERQDRAEAAEQAARAELSRRSAEAEAAAADERSAADERRQAEAAREAARQAQAEREPALQQASALDAELRSLAARGDELSAELLAGREALRAAEQEASSLAAAQAEAQAARDRAAAGLAELSPLARLSAEWERWRQLLGRYLRAARELALLDRSALSAALADARERAAREAMAEGRVGERAARSEELARLAEERSAAFDPSALRQQRDWLLAQQSRLGSLARAAEEARSALALRLACTEAAEQASLDREAEQRKAENAARERARLDAALDEAQAALAQATAALDLTDRRAHLVDGAPCPLCGASEHPWAREAPALASLVQGQQKRVAYLLSARQAADRDEISSKTRMRELRDRARDELARAQQQDEALAELRIRWGKLRSQTALDALPDDPHDPAAAAAVVEAERAVEARLAEVRSDEQRMDEASRSLARARRDLDAARREQDRARREADAARAAAEQASLALARADETIARRRDEQTAIVDELAPALEGWPGWRDALAGDVEAFGKACAGELTRFRAHEQALAEAEARLAEIGPRLLLARDRARDRAAQAEARSLAEADHQRRLAELRGQRSRLLDGLSVEAAASSLQKAVALAEAAEARALPRHELAERRAASAAGALAATEQLLRLRLDELAQAREQLASLAGDLPVDALRAVARLGAPAVQRRRAALDALALRLDHAQLIADERRSRAGASPGDGPRAEQLADDEINRSSRALVEAEERAARALVRLADDGEQRRRARDLVEALDAQRQRADLWASLAQLIGSADGKKFRVFAQSLTFDSLIAQANLHLDELARRYQLMRVPGTDLDLQVIDREMADEVRPTTSLSGGESFLLSLSLALALSSLGSRDTRVETLFIDEGFGTLDPEALEVALAALDALQGTGRQVGLISHVPGLVDRLGAHVRVQPCGAGRSVVRTEEA